MVRTSPTSPGTTGFVATLVLVCAFAILASALWTPRAQGPATLATDDAALAPGATPAVATER